MIKKETIDNKLLVEEDAVYSLRFDPSLYTDSNLKRCANKYFLRHIERLRKNKSYYLTLPYLEANHFLNFLNEGSINITKEGNTNNVHMYFKGKYVGYAVEWKELPERFKRFCINSPILN